MKCPLCKTMGARIDKDALEPSNMISDMIICKNRDCNAFRPPLYGVDQNKATEKKKRYHAHQYQKDSDYDDIDFTFNNAEDSADNNVKQPFLVAFLKKLLKLPAI